MTIIEVTGMQVKSFDVANNGRCPLTMPDCVSHDLTS